jgi:hypothetical protein
MLIRRVVSASVLLTLSALVPACGDSGSDDRGDEISTGLSTDESDSSGSESETAEGSTTADETADETGCASPCGDECCAADEQCDPVNLECVIDCGDDEPCGVDEPVCCGDAELCYVGQCIVPGGACEGLVCATKTDSGCDVDEICDADLGLCVPDLADVSCTFTPEAGVFDPVPRWSWGVRQARDCMVDDDCQAAEICNAGACEVTWTHVTPTVDDYPDHVQAMASPMVADLDGDCIPEVIFNSFAGANWSANGVLRVVRGDTGAPVWSLGDLAWRSDASAIPAIGDLDLDGDLEIVNVGEDNRLMLIDHLGAPVWKTTDPYAGNQASGAPALANFDLQGHVEIAYGRAIYDSAGNQVWVGNGGIGTNGPYAVLPCVADLDGDLRPELIGGNTVYQFTGTVGVDFVGSVRWQSGTDGFCGIADFQLDGLPEVVLIRGGNIAVLDGQTGTQLAVFAIPGGGGGGPPNIADFDGDGFPDIGTAGGSRYVVVKFDGIATITKLWDAVTKDVSSNRTGSSVFDLDGDGRSEVVYGDEWYLRIYPGLEPDCAIDPPGPLCDQNMTDAEILFRDIESSATRVEYPVIADVDGDFKAEIIVSTNNYSEAGSIGDGGVEVFEDRLDNWVTTRPIWNQHTYHITNVEADGSIPLVEEANWLTPIAKPYNSYRRNTQGAVENCAPDLVAQDLESVGVCESDVTFSARVCNQGCLGVGPGVEVTFSEAEAGVLATIETDKAIPAGGCIKVQITIPAPANPAYDVSVSVDDDGVGAGAFNECIEDNNAFGPVELCPNIG